MRESWAFAHPDGPNTDAMQAIADPILPTKTIAGRAGFDTGVTMRIDMDRSSSDDAMSPTRSVMGLYRP